MKENTKLFTGDVGGGEINVGVADGGNGAEGIESENGCGVVFNIKEAVLRKGLAELFGVEAALWGKFEVNLGGCRVMESAELCESLFLGED